MASSVARMHSAAAGPFGAHHVRLKKVLVRTPPPPTFSSADPDTPTRRRHSQILDRWAARRAREMVTTIEQQSHRADLRESSPAMSDSGSSVASSRGGGGGSVGNATDLPQNVRASSLIQMWRELEAEAGVIMRTPRAPRTNDDSEASGDSEPEVTTNSNSLVGATDSEKGRVGSIVRMLSIKSRTPRDEASCGSSLETNESVQQQVASSEQKEWFGLPSGGTVRLRCRREVEDLMERMKKDRKTEIEAIGGRHPVSQFSHRGRIQSVLKVRFLRRESAFRDPPQPVSKKRESDRSQNGSSILLLRERFDQRNRHNANGVEATESSTSVNIHCPIMSKDSTESANQPDANNNQHHDVVSISTGYQESLPSGINSPHSGNQDSPDSRAEHMPELNSMCSRSESVFELNLPCSRTEGTHELNSQNSIDEDAHELNSLQSRSEGVFELNLPCSRTEGTHELNSQNSIDEDAHELNSLHSRSEDTPELNSPLSRSEELQGIQISDASWDERSLWVGNWQGSLDSSTSQVWQHDNEIERYTRHHVPEIGHIWIGSCSPSWRGWEGGEHDYHDFLESFSDKLEIRELLERRRVSSSLASDFCDKMNRMISSSFITRQEQLYIDENFSEEYEEQPTWRQNYEFSNADHVASESSLIPSSYQSANYPESWQYTSFPQNSPPVNSQEQETIPDLRTEMAQVHQDINQLRKLVESCLEWQTKLQQSIKDEVSSAVRQSLAKTSDSSKRTQSQKDTCRICYEMKIDSLLYKCGHMCTCFKCAHELQWNSGRCLICHSPIVDVVRAYPPSS